MRRLAAVFASKRSDRSDAASSSGPSATTDQSEATTKPSSSKRFFRSLSRKSKPVDPFVNRLNSSDIHPPSSASSSSGAPTTPDDDRRSLLRAPPSKAWLSLPLPVDPRLGSFHHLEPLLHDPHRLSIPPRPLASPSTLDTEDEFSDESSIAPDPPRPPERSTPLAAPAYLLAFTTSNLRPPYAPPPLLHISNGPIFPRSSNSPPTLPHADSLESTMHRTRLQRRLQRGNLSPSESRSITSFSGRRSAIKQRLSLHLDDTPVRAEQLRSYSAGLRKWVDRPCFEDRVHVLLAENVPTGPSSEPSWTRIQPATVFGVAALEYSLTLELLAGFYEDDLPCQQERHDPVPDASALGYLRLDTQLTSDLDPSLTQSQSPTTLSPASPASSSNPPSPATMSSPSSVVTVGPGSKPVSATSISPSQSRGQSYKATPSPLRMEAASASSPMPRATVVPPPASAASIVVASPISSAPAIASPPPSSAPAPLKPALKQGVRFVEEKDDQVPLAYVKRIKREREAKARFLEAEGHRRKHEEERRKHEEEKRKWEEERAQWEREKRAIAEERKKRLYADEVAAARSRRESQRFGPLGAMTGEGLATGQWDRGDRSRPDRPSSGAYSRAAHDSSHVPIRQGSDSSLVPPKPSRQGSASGSGSASPGDSRPNSVYGAGSTSGSRPPSMHSGAPTPSSSQQDVRNRERRMSSTGSRRGSMISESGGSWRRSEVVPVPPLPPAWNMGMNMSMPMAQMPMAVSMQAMPMYGMGLDMPLLPPSPPFMMQQFGYRSPSGHGSQPSSPQRSHSSSPTLGRQQLAATGSSERVNRMSQARGSSASARAPSLPRSESGPHRSGHQRTSSGGTPQHPPAGSRSRAEDRRRPTMPSEPPRPGPMHRSSMPSHPPPVFSQARSSWAVPQVGFENVSRPNAGRRQTVIS